MRCEKCGCTLFSCQCPEGPTNQLADAAQAAMDQEQRLVNLLRGPKVGADGKIVGGTYDGMTPAEVLAQRDSYNRIVGE